jgi:hypothetical protein
LEHVIATFVAWSSFSAAFSDPDAFTYRNRNAKGYFEFVRLANAGGLE